MYKYSPYIVAALVILLAAYILIKHIIRLLRGRSACGCCDQDSEQAQNNGSSACSSGCAGCSWSGRCNQQPDNQSRQDKSN